MKKETMMKTKRLLLQPMSPEALEAKIRTLTDPELKKAYGEMLSGCKEKPEDLLWYTPWQMIRKTDGKALGDLGFKGAPRKGTVEIGYGIEKDFEPLSYQIVLVKLLMTSVFETLIYRFLLRMMRT